MKDDTMANSWKLPKTRLQKAVAGGVGRTVKFIIPLVPPSVNHYVKHTRSGRHYVTKEARAFKEAILLLCKDYLHGKTYEVQIWIYLAKGQSGDVDNFPKCVLDGLKDAGIVESDARFKDMHVYLRRDAANPRTEILVTVLT